MGWFELLCCPTAMGCTILLFEPRNADGGEPKYEVKLRLSHSEYVPRYQLHVVKDRKIMPWIVGHMEKRETHLRAKPGEFVRVQIWNLTCNSMVMEKRRSARQRKSRPCMRAVKERPTPSAIDMQTRGMSIAVQAKMDLEADGDDAEEAARFDPATERWVQMIGVDTSLYKISIEPARGGENHTSMKSMSVMRILYKGQKVCVARKQRFAGALGRVEQPFLGVQIKPPEPAEQVPTDESQPDSLQLLLDTNSLMLLLMCLAWSEETMSPQVDMTPRFIQAMRARPGEAGSAQDCGLSVQWDTEDVKSRLKSYNYAKLYNWNKETVRDKAEAATPTPMGTEP